MRTFQNLYMASVISCIEFRWSLFWLYRKIELQNKVVRKMCKNSKFSKQLSVIRGQIWWLQPPADVQDSEKTFWLWRDAAETRMQNNPLSYILLAWLTLWLRRCSTFLQNVDKLISDYTPSQSTVLFTVTAEKISNRFIFYLWRLSCYTLRDPYRDLPNLREWYQRACLLKQKIHQLWNAAPIWLATEVGMWMNEQGYQRAEGNRQFSMTIRGFKWRVWGLL